MKGKKKNNKTEKIDPKKKKENKIEENLQNDMNKNCINHKLSLKYFCETCIEPICDYCLTNGPHNNNNHRINNLDNAFEEKYNELNKLIVSLLKNKKNSLDAQIFRINYRIDEFKYLRRIIERDIRSRYNSIIVRLENHSLQKKSVLNSEIMSIEKSLDDINLIIAQFGNLNNKLKENPKNGPNILNMINVLIKNINVILNQFINQNIQIDFNLPRELDEEEIKLKRINDLEILSCFKNKIIEKIYSKINENKIKQYLIVNENIQNEIKEWTNLTQKYYDEINNFNMICYYCAEPLNEKNMNKNCKINVKSKISNDFIGFTKDIPKYSYNGNKRHFFDNPKDEIFKNNDNIPYYNLENSIQNIKLNNLKENNKIVIEKLLSEIKTKCYHNNINLYEIFKYYDEKELNMMNHIKFYYILNEYFDILEKDIDIILKVFDPKNIKLINYIEFINLVENSNLLKNLKYFENEDLSEKKKINKENPEKEKIN